MYTGQMVFSQLMDFLPKHEFNKCVRRYQGNYRVRKFSCLDQFLCMVFAQLTYRESLRDTETCLRAVESKLFHVGIRGRVSRSTLADANETRDWRIWADFAQVLVGRARQLYAGENFGLALQQSAYALDSTTIDLCLSLFPWARFRRRKGAIRVHTLMDLRGSIPCFIRITAANVHDVNILDELLLQPGAFYVMDRAYTDFARLYTFTRSLAFFCGSCQKQSPLLPTRLPPRRQVHRPTQRSENPPSRAENVPSLSRCASPHQLRRYRYPEALGLLDQQLLPSTPDDCPPLQVPLACGVVLQMDQTVPSDQGLLWNLPERRQDPDLDRHQRLLTRGHSQKGTENRPQSRRNLANSQHHPVRKSLYESST